MKIGSTFKDRNKKGEERQRTKDDVFDEITKDVSALLNSAGGTIIYGILEKSSKADKLDQNNAFKSGNAQDEVRPEKLVQWLRLYIQPPPTLNVYSVYENSGDPDSPWYLVVEVEQGQQAYMARDKRFYKRVGAIVQPMEQYEVADVMNRTRAAVLDFKIKIGRSEPRGSDRIRLHLNIVVTSANFVASEYGAIKTTLSQPLRLVSGQMPFPFPGARHETRTSLYLEDGKDTPDAESIMVRWGANNGSIVFPGDWYNFNNNALVLEVPELSAISNSTYLVEVELFTVNSASKKILYCICRAQSGDGFELSLVTPENYANVIDAFWKTYHLAHEKIK